MTIVRVSAGVRWCVLVFVALLSIGIVKVAQQKNQRAYVLPVPGELALDGDLRDWDLSGALECVYDEALPDIRMRIAFMYDEGAFYVGAHFVDGTPLLNRHDPAVEPSRGWDADALQVRLCSDAQAPYPLPRSNDEHICHLTMWFYTDRELPCLHIAYGTDFHGVRLWTGEDSGLAFRKDEDGRGYTLEGRIPWERLNASAPPPAAGDSIALTVQPLWGDSSGRRYANSIFDLVRTAGFSYKQSQTWGQGVLLPRGHLPPSERPRAAAESLKPLTISLPLPDSQAKSLSAAICDTRGQLVRTLASMELKAERPAGRAVALPWDGLDDDGRPLPSGSYTVKVLTHRGVGLKYVTSLHSAGNPPWCTADGTGAWGGDHGPPIAAASDEQRVYLGWTLSEAGKAIVAVDRRFRADGKVRKLWGRWQIGEIGCWVTAMERSGDLLFVAQDGRRWGRRDPQAQRQAGVVLWDARTGKPVNFPFGKRVLHVRDWPPEDEKSDPKWAEGHIKRFWERFPDGDFGPQETGWNLLGITVDGDVLYVSLRLEDKIVAYNWRTGKKIMEYSVPSPVGLAVAPDGGLYAVSGKNILRLDPRSGQTKTVVGKGLSVPWDLALDGGGRLYVTDCGKAMQVKVFDRQGNFLGAIGKPGGRPWVGRYDPKGMLRPSGITVDSDGKIWVCEHDNTPRRVSVWTRDGRLVADLLGPGAYAVEGIADEERPEWVNVHNTLFEVDYATGRTKTLSTLIRPQMRGFQFAPDGVGGRGLLFRHVRGNTYLIHGGRGGIVIYRLGGDLVAQPVAALGAGRSLHLFGFTAEDIPESLRVQFQRTGRPFGYCWSDLNGDGLVQQEELVIERVPGFDAVFWLYRGTWVDDELTIWTAEQFKKGVVWRLPVRKWLPGGVPVYDRPGEQKPAFTVLGKSVIDSVMGDGDSVYVLEQEGGNAQGSGAKWMAVSRYALDGRRLWAYRRAWLGFALESPLFQPGCVIGALKFIGKAKLDNGMKLIAVNGYYGQFNLLTDTGLWVAALAKDKRYGPPADEYVIWPENFSGFFFRNQQNGKFYLIAGDTDARIWEVRGLETVRTAQMELTLTQEDHKEALQVAARLHGVPPEQGPLRLGRVAEAVRVDGNLREWDMSKAAALEGGAARSAKVQLAYDEQNLYAAFEVVDASPMANKGEDYGLLFKTGDACDVMLATEPGAEPGRMQPAAGDVRLLFSVLEGKPVCVLYEPILRGGERQFRLFTSPGGAVPFDRVAVLEAARVALVRKRNGYTLEAALPLKALRFAPRPGTTTRGDVGVIFSDAAGSRAVLRLYYANKDTAIVDDIPTQARLEPLKWTIVTVE